MVLVTKTVAVALFLGVAGGRVLQPKQHGLPEWAVAEGVQQPPSPQ